MRNESSSFTVSESEVWNTLHHHVLKCSKTHLQQTRISKNFRGTNPRPPLLDPPLNTMNRAANCLTPALTGQQLQMLIELPKIRYLNLNVARQITGTRPEYSSAFGVGSMLNLTHAYCIVSYRIVWMRCCIRLDSRVTISAELGRVSDLLVVRRLISRASAICSGSVSNIEGGAK